MIEPEGTNAFISGGKNNASVFFNSCPSSTRFFGDAIDAEQVRFYD
jgi:hypothetical protein